MKNEKGKNLIIIVLIIVIAILSTILTLSLTGVFDSKKETTNSGNNVGNSENNNIENNEETQINNWMDFIINSDIESVYVNSCKDGDLEITKEDLQKIFSELKKGKLIKDYYGGMGNICYKITINYDNQILELLNYKYVSTKDKQVISLLELEDYKVEYNIPSPDYMFRYDYDVSIIDSIISSK